MPLTLEEARGFIIHYTIKLEPFRFADNTIIGGALNTAPNASYIAVCEVLSDHGYYISVSATTAAGEGPHSTRLSLLPLIGQPPHCHGNHFYKAGYLTNDDSNYSVHGLWPMY